MFKVKTLGFVGLLAMNLGCSPDALEGFESGNTNTNNATNGTTNNTTGAGGTFTPEFVEVTGILTANCADPACHGSFATNAFTVPTDKNATPSEMRAGLQNVMATSGKPLIKASDPDGSEMWIRMTLATTDPLYMPSTKAVLTDGEYTAIQNWITAGAIYTQ